jgi:hypothetical protein
LGALVLRLMLALSMGLNRVDISLPLTWGQKEFLKHCVFYYLEIWMTDKVQKPSHSKKITLFEITLSWKRKNAPLIIHLCKRYYNFMQIYVPLILSHFSTSTHRNHYIDAVSQYIIANVYIILNCDTT